MDLQLTKDEEKEQFWRNKVGATVQQINSYATYADEMRLDQPAAEEEEEEEEIEVCCYRRWTLDM